MASEVTDEALQTAVDSVLERAGMADAFTVALDGLRGQGLEESTDPQAARYGAALVLLSTAQAGTFPAQ